jgi:hypothetical protein
MAFADLHAPDYRAGVLVSLKRQSAAVRIYQVGFRGTFLVSFLTRGR